MFVRSTTDKLHRILLVTLFARAVRARFLVLVLPLMGSTRWRGSPYTNLHRLRMGGLPRELYTGLLVFDARSEI